MSDWIVLDRDGVINFDSDNYIKSLEEWKPIPGSIEAISRLSQAGFKVAIATNQSGISRELFGLDELESIHHELNRLVEAEGGSIAGIFYCPHLPDDHCECRKPKIGLLDEIENQFDISLDKVPFIGDSERDVQAAQSKGMSPILVRTGKGEKTKEVFAGKPEYATVPIYADLASYVNTLLEKQ